MRVIAGSAKRIQLKTLKGLETRPTTDRIKETLFNMIDPWIGGCSFLDLFAGSGGIGIEALSRGAEEAVFVEKNRAAAAVIRENLKVTRLEGHAEVIQADVSAGLHRLCGRQFDYIFMDPPYNHGLEREVLAYLTDSRLADKDTVVIIEASKETKEEFVSSLGWKLLRVKDYKTNKHIFTAKGDC